MPDEQRGCGRNLAAEEQEQKQEQQEEEEECGRGGVGLPSLLV